MQAVEVSVRTWRGGGGSCKFPWSLLEELKFFKLYESEQGEHALVSAIISYMVLCSISLEFENKRTRALKPLLFNKLIFDQIPFMVDGLICKTLSNLKSLIELV